MKRRHHNNKGSKQIKEGKTVRQVECMAKRFRIWEKKQKKDKEQD